MDVIREDANRECLKGTAVANSPISLSQVMDFFAQQAAGTVSKNDREEENASLYVCAAIVRHVR
jgi:hypothetical protein